MPNDEIRMTNCHERMSLLSIRHSAFVRHALFSSLSVLCVSVVHLSFLTPRQELIQVVSSVVAP